MFQDKAIYTECEREQFIVVFLVQIILFVVESFISIWNVEST